jgi:hypothetical protein
VEYDKTPVVSFGIIGAGLAIDMQDAFRNFAATSSFGKGHMGSVSPDSLYGRIRNRKRLNKRDPSAGCLHFPHLFYSVHQHDLHGNPSHRDPIRNSGDAEDLG